MTFADIFSLASQDASSALAVFVRVPTDLGFYLFVGLTYGCTHLLVWLIARDSSDMDWWRSLGTSMSVAVPAGVALAFFQNEASLSTVIGGILLALFIAWLVYGWLFDLEIWQRIVMTVATPAIAVGMFLVAYWLKGLILGGLTG